ncbi:MAG: outer membrane protein assembly factor BamC [Candidatus Competibacteraceae bacterium]|nr:outer membrane protein assembly factor BamC [Candidatus Competibacteraceae bacterium]
MPSLPALFSAVLRHAYWAGMIGLLAACTVATEDLIPDRRPDYRQSRTLDPLEVPPDLTGSTIDDTLLVPEFSPTGSATLSDYAGERTTGQVTASSGETVLQQQPDIRVERDGQRRWLVVDEEPDVLWPRIKEFWTGNGLLLEKDDPRIGIMETRWAENRADIPDGPVRSLLGRVMDFAYSAPTRDKFRVRLERVDDGTEVYLTHYGVEEVVRGGNDRQGGDVIWQTRPPDSELETEMLNRLMVYLGAAERREQVQLARSESTAAPGPRAEYTQVSGQQALSINDGYSRAWRLVGLALDGSRFVVENQNRAQGLYEVEYRSLEDEGRDEGGLLSGLAFWKDDPPPPGVRYKVRLASQGAQTLVVVQNAAGQADNSSTAQQILTALHDVINGKS